MIDYATPLLLTLCGLGFAVIGAFLYEIGRSDERKHIKEEYETKTAKLWEYIYLKEMCWKHVGWCDECPYNGAEYKYDDCICTVQEKVNSLAHELGIEADEC